MQDPRKRTSKEYAYKILDLEDEIERLKTAIRKHRDQKDDDRCWLDDQELYEALGEPVPPLILPAKECFLESCERYWKQRQSPHAKLDPEDMTIAQLTERIKALGSKGI